MSGNDFEWDGFDVEVTPPPSESTSGTSRVTRLRNATTSSSLGAVTGNGLAASDRQLSHAFSSRSVSSVPNDSDRKRRANWLSRKLKGLRKTGDVDPHADDVADTFTADTLGDELNNPLGRSGSENSAWYKAGSTNDPEGVMDSPRCRHNLPEHRRGLTAGMDMLAPRPAGFSREVSIGSVGNVAGVRVYLRKGEDLMPTDKTGLSDPFCKFSLGKSKHKSKIKTQTLNPMWSEEFFLACPEDSREPIYLEVLDKDRLSVDFMGEAYLDTSSLQLDEPKEMVVELTPGKKKGLPSQLGRIYVTLTRTFEFSKKERKARKKEGAEGDRLVTIDVVEARNLCPMDTDGAADPYVKVKLGKHKFKTKHIKSNLYPTWRQRFEFQLHDQSQVVTFVVLDKDDFGEDDFMGQCEVNLADVGMDKTFEAWLPLDEQEDAGDLHVMVTVTDLYADGVDLELSTEDSMKYCGMLTVDVLRAKKLEVKDMSTSDPFVVIEVGNTRLRTLTMPKNLNPEWNKSFNIPVKDVFDCAIITVFDEDKGGKQEFMGCVIVPLLEAPTTDTWYPLKDKRLMDRHKGEILLNFKLTYKTIPACKMMIKPHEARHMEEEEKFKVQLLKLHMGRVVKLLRLAIGAAQTVDGLFKWQFGFAKSFTAMIFWVLACLFLELWMVPLMLGLFLVYNYYLNNNSRAKYSAEGEIIDVEAFHDDDGAEEEETDDAPKKGLREKWQSIMSVGQTIQNVLDKVASHGESVKNLTNWSVPLITRTLMMVMFAASLGLYIIPLRYILLVAGVRQFLKKGLYAYGVFKLPKWHRSSNPIAELLERVPSDIQLVQRKRLQSLRDNQLRRRGKSRKG